MAHGTVKIVDHQPENRVNFLLSVSRVVSERRILQRSPVSLSNLKQKREKRKRKHTQGGRSKMTRARYMAAADT